MGTIKTIKLSEKCQINSKIWSHLKTQHQPSVAATSLLLPHSCSASPQAPSWRSMPPNSRVLAPASPSLRPRPCSKVRASESSKASKSWMPATTPTKPALPLQRIIIVMNASTTSTWKQDTLSISSENGAQWSHTLLLDSSKTVPVSPIASEIFQAEIRLACSIWDLLRQMLTTNSVSVHGNKTSTSGLKLSPTATRSTGQTSSSTEPIPTALDIFRL